MFSISNYCFIVIGLYKWKNYLFLYYIVSTYLVYFWPTKVVTILFTDFSVMIKCFLSDNFIEYIILLLKLFVNYL